MIPSTALIKEIERSEIDYLTDRMIAIQSRDRNPEGVEILKLGNAHCFYSKTMPWSTFNTVKGLANEDVEHIATILDFYRERNRKVQIEAIPSLINENVLRRLAESGLYQSGFHTSLIIQPQECCREQEPIRIQEIHEDQFEQYAAIHCRGTGLSDDGIPHVARNNKVLYSREGWKFYMAYVQDAPAAVGVMFMNNRIASLTFAATLPEYRNQGLHRQLLRRRITEAYRQGCHLVVGQCSFLSQSHRNMEQVGMKIGYVRTAWTEK